jgi:transposase-like protein
LPQALLPLVPDGATTINDRISIIRQNGEWTYFYGVDPIFRHPETDRRSFRMFTAQLICHGRCRQSDVVRTFGVSANSVKRSVKKFREMGIASFFQPRAVRGATVMTADVTRRAQELLDRGRSRREVATELGIKCDTLRKAIKQERLQEPAPSTVSPMPRSTDEVSDKSDRSVADASAEMGVACTRPIDRVLAAVGALQGAPTEFEACRDVSFGGVLCGLPALAENGLFEHLLATFPSLSGYYTTLHVVTLLAYMALCRIKTVEQLQYAAPGELGKLMGLDRVPEVRCLRKKLSRLSAADAPEQWAARLSQQWFEADPQLAGTLYVDGHVRLYHGNQTELPRRYVSRQRLCLRGTTDYWVNDAVGQPFFVVERPVDQGMLEALQSDIVPRLLREVPNQPTEQDLIKDPYRHRFVIVFDREGYSPAFFKDMWTKHRIACITYHKYPKDTWPEEYFQETQVTLANGEQPMLMLAEMGSWIGDRKHGLWVREVRKLTSSGRQVSLISSAYSQIAMQDAAGMFSRWSQENFFRYMREHYAIDLLSEHRTEEIPGTKRPVVNPAWRELDRRIRSLNGKLQQRRAQFAAHALHPESDEKAIPKWEQRKGELLELVQQDEHELEQLKEQRRQTSHHIDWDQLPNEDKFQRLAPSRKRLIDTVKLIAYRAETAMMNIVREVLLRDDDARSLLRDLFRTDADLTPDIRAGVLRVSVHGMANPRSNRAIRRLLDELNATEFSFPGTQLKLEYTLLGHPIDPPTDETGAT